MVFFPEEEDLVHVVIQVVVVEVGYDIEKKTQLSTKERST